MWFKVIIVMKFKLKVELALSCILNFARQVFWSIFFASQTKILATPDLHKSSQEASEGDRI